MLLRGALHGHSGLVVAWPGVCPGLGSLPSLALAVADLRLEDLVPTGGIECFRPQLLEIIEARPRVVGPWLVVVPVICLLEEPPIDFAEIELILRGLRMYLRLLWRVSRRSNLIKAAARVRGSCQLASWYTWSHSVWNDGVLAVGGGFVLQESLVDRLQLIPLGGLVVVARIGIVEVRGALHEAGSRRRRAKSWYL